MTVQATVTITNATGLHARPAALFVEEAKKYAATVSLWNGSKKGNAKSITSLLLLGVSQGTTLTIEADGDDAEAAVSALRDLLAHLER